MGNNDDIQSKLEKLKLEVTDNSRVNVGFNFKTYRPSRGASADPFALADTTVLAGASCLAFSGTRLLTAGEEDGVDA